jgi:hypothetical protein
VIWTTAATQPRCWRPHNGAHLAAIRLVVGLAPALCRCLDSDDDHEVTTVTGAVWAALKGAAYAYRLPAAEVDLDAAASRALLEDYDAVWLLMQALDVLSKVPQPTRRESATVTARRQHWGLRVHQLHRDLAARLAP